MLKRTPFFNLHKQAGAKLIDFGGWEMPVQYESISAEHNAVRNRVGLFDVSHMGEFFVRGPEAKALIQHLTINDAAKLQPGKAQYSAMCYADGGIVDDLLVYMLANKSYMLVVNASNIEKDLAWVKENNDFDATVKNKSDEMCLLAVQGPDAVKTLQKLTTADLSSIKFYTFEQDSFAGFDNIILSATGYTGEKGFELYFNKQEVDPAAIWHAIMEAGAEFDIQPCGLGARDTLRLEMGFALYGQDITQNTNPLEAGMGWLSKLQKGEFIGQNALLKVKEKGTNRKLTGLVLDKPRDVARHGYKIFDSEGEKIGEITSGSRSITLGKNIALGYVSNEYAVPDQRVMVQIRNRKAAAITCKLPFIER